MLSKEFYIKVDLEGLTLHPRDKIILYASDKNVNNLIVDVGERFRGLSQKTSAYKDEVSIAVYINGTSNNTGYLVTDDDTGLTPSKVKIKLKDTLVAGEYDLYLKFGHYKLRQGNMTEQSFRTDAIKIEVR